MNPRGFSRKRCATVTIVMVLLYGSHSLAQTLADAAREARAKQQSETNTRIFVNTNEPGIPSAGPTPSPTGDSSPATTANGTAGGRHQIPYEAYEGSSQRVIIKVKLNGRVDARLAVDTGAPGTILFPALARQLGLLDDTGGGVATMAGGIGGTVPAIYTIVDTIRVGDTEQQFFPTKIVPTGSDAFDGLIGMDFLSSYVTRIDPRLRLFILEDVAPSSTVYGQRNELWWRSNYREFSDLRQSWREYADRLDKAIEKSNVVAGGGIEEARSNLAFAKKQVQEADRLLDVLNDRAIRFQVPMRWRN
jgi:hypothetical protein